MGSSRIKWKLRAGDGRRSNVDRRNFSYSAHIPERRQKGDRRTPVDRRTLSDRKSAAQKDLFPSAKAVKEIITICASCRRIRNNKGLWQQIEVDTQKFSEVQFSHGICPECVKKLYPDLSPDLIDQPGRD